VPTMAHLVAPGGGTLRVISGPTGAVGGAVDMAPIAAAADHDLHAAAGTEEQPRRDGIVLAAPTGPLMTGAARAAILLRHTCPGTVWCTVPKQNLPVGLGAVLATYRVAPAPPAPARSIPHCCSSLRPTSRAMPLQPRITLGLHA
jgi:hypothetical protein